MAPNYSKWLLISVVCLTVLIACKSGNQPAGSTVQQTEVKAGNDSSAVVAKINGKPVTLAQVDEKVGGLVNKFKEINPNMKFPDDKMNKLRKDYLNRIILDTVLLEEADHRNITVTPEEVKSRVEQLKTLFGQTEEAKKYFAEGVKDWDKFNTEVERKARIQKLYDAEFEKTKIDVTDEQINDYFKNNPDKFKVPEQVKARQILAAFKVKAANVPVGDDEKQEAKQRIMTVQEKLKAGEDFAKTAEQLSDDKASAAKGGDMGLFPRKRYPQPVEDAAFALKPGDVSDPIETPKGFCIIKVEEHNQAYDMVLNDEVKDKVKQSLIRDQKAKIQKEFEDRMLKEAKVETFDLPSQ